MKNKFRFWVKLTLALIYLVILAGAVVRMTGSGMGCPDWPKCFGYLIPPTEASQLEWHAQQDYHKGEVIIVEEALQVAKDDFKSSERLNPENWEAYTKHDYALFNVYHTWIEFINRLLGALAGLATLIMTVFSFGYWSKRKRIPLLSVAVLLGMGFQGWLGKTVVDSNLQPFKITIHMGMALLLVALLILLLHYTKKEVSPVKFNLRFQLIAGLGFILTVFQIAMGTQLRQYIDHQMELWQAESAFQWLADTPLIFYVHRSFSLTVLAVHGYLWYVLKKNNFIPKVFYNILGLILLEIITGIAMYYFDFPFSSQPLHLIFASLLFGAQAYFLLAITTKFKQL